MVCGQRKGNDSPTLSFLLELPLNHFCASVQNNIIVSLKEIKSPQVFPNLDAMQTYIDLQHSSTEILNNRIK